MYDHEGGDCKPSLGWAPLDRGPVGWALSGEVLLDLAMPNHCRVMGSAYLISGWPRRRVRILVCFLPISSPWGPLEHGFIISLQSWNAPNLMLSGLLLLSESFLLGLSELVSPWMMFVSGLSDLVCPQVIQIGNVPYIKLYIKKVQ